VRFVLVLPGETEANGSALTATGRQQAQAAAAEVGRLPSDVSVIHSPATVAVETATIIGDALGAAAPELRNELAQPAEDTPLEGPQEDVWAIIEASKTQLEPDATLVIVTHEINVRLLVCRALGMPLEEMHRFALDPGSITTIEWRTQPRERLLIASLNEVCHLVAFA